MDTDVFTVGPFAENTYLISDQGKSILIDPGFYEDHEFRTFQKKLSETGNQLIAVCLTHAHLDHILGLQRVLDLYEVPVYLNHSDLYLWKELPGQAKMFGFKVDGFNFIPEELPEKKQFIIGPFQFDVIYTPGHAPDHVSLYFANEELLIAGDTIFRESIGRTDLYKGNFDLLASSIKEKIYTLPEHTTVFPGHGPSTTVGHEKRENPFVKSEK
jgi:glyoxylase-like metal-dependent hydrolase (beta-lactamase superfamily II)